MRRERAADQSRGAGTGSEVARRPGRGFLERRMRCQSQIVVGGEIENLAPVNDRARNLRRIDTTQFSTEVFPFEGLEPLAELLLESTHYGTRTRKNSRGRSA